MAEQGLPTSFENSAATWQNMPMIAAMYTGQQNQLAKENQMALQEAFAKEQVQKAKMNPLELLAKEASTRLNNSQAGSADSLARLHGLQADLAAGTLGSDIGAGNAKNMAGMAKSAADQGDDEGRRYGQLATALRTSYKDAPAPLKAQLIVRQLGIPDPDGRVAAGLVSKMDTIPDMLDEHANGIYSRQKSSRETAQKEAGDTERQKIIAAAQRDVAKTRGDATEAAAATAAAAKVEAVYQNAKLSLKNRSAALEEDALKEKDPAKKAELQRQATYAKAMYDFTEQLRNATNKAGALDIPGIVGEPGIPNSTPMAPPVRPQQGTIPGLPANLKPKASGPPNILSPAALSWLERAVKANPGMTNEQILAEGERLGKLK